MPVLRTEGFVLRSHPLGEADKIMTFFSRDEGKIRAVARSARKSRRRFGSSLELWSRVSIQVFHKEGMELGRLDSCDLLESAFRLQEDVEMGFLLAYLAEVTDHFIRDGQSEPHYYRLVRSLLEALRLGLAGMSAQAYFEVWTLRLHGLLPDLEECGSCGNSLVRLGGMFQASTGQILCRRCLPRPLGGDHPLDGRGLNTIKRFLRTHPAELVQQELETGTLRALLRVTGAALTAFVEGPFRTARFLPARGGQRA